MRYPDIQEQMIMGITMSNDAKGMPIGAALTDAVESIGRMEQRAACQDVHLARNRRSQELDIIWTLLGFRFKESNDRVLQPATLPAGWLVKPTDHYIHNDIVDENGVKRAHFMYKPDPWDRDASMNLRSRFCLGGKDIRNPEDPYSLRAHQYPYVVDHKTGQEIQLAPAYVYDETLAPPVIHGNAGDADRIMEYLNRREENRLYLKYNMSRFGLEYDHTKTDRENLVASLKAKKCPLTNPAERERLTQVENRDVCSAYVRRFTDAWCLENAPAYVNIDRALAENQAWMQERGASEIDILRFQAGLLRHGVWDSRVNSDFTAHLYW